METGVTIYKPKSAVVVRREMAKIPAVMDALGPVERSVFLASTDKTIAEYDANELSIELAKALKWIAKDVGYRATDESERGYLVVRVAEILKRYYDGLTMRDFKMAFEMSITGELDDYLPRGRDGQADRGHYQQFNAEYVCKILNAYKARRKSVLRKANDAMPKPEAKPNAKVVSDLMLRQKQIFIEVLENYRINKRFPDGMTPITVIICCDVLAGCGLMPEIEVTPQEQQQIFQRTMNHYARMGNVGDLERLRKAGPTEPELQQKVFALARRNTLRMAIERIIKEEIEITDYVKFD